MDQGNTLLIWIQLIFWSGSPFTMTIFTKCIFIMINSGQFTVVSETIITRDLNDEG